VFRSPAPARARCGPRGAAAAGFVSQVVTPLGAGPQPALRPVIVHLPPHRAKVGPGTYLAAGRVGVQTPLGFQQQPPPRPVFVHVPPARARLGLRGQAAGGVASAVVTPLGSPSQPAPRPVIQHLPPARAVLGPRRAPAGGIASSVVTPLGNLPQPALRPVIVHLPPRRVVWRGLATQNYPPALVLSRPRPFVFRSPVPARAHLGPRGIIAAGVASQVVTPLGSLPRPAPRPVISHLPPPARARLGTRSQPAAGLTVFAVTIAAKTYQRPPIPPHRPAPARALWRGYASRIVTPLGSASRPRPFVSRSLPPPRARLGASFQPGAGIASQAVTVLPGVLQWARPVIPGRLPPPLTRAVTGHGTVAAGIASRIVTPLGHLPPPRKVQIFPPKITRAWVGHGTTAGGINVLAPPTLGAPPPAISIIIGQRRTGRALTGHNRIAGGLSGPAPVSLGALQPTVPVVEFRPPPPTRARIRGLAVPALIVPAAQAYQRPAPKIKRPAPARAATGPRGTTAGGYASRVVTPLGTISPARKVPIFPPKNIRARIGHGTVSGGIASANLIPAAQPYLRPAPQIKRPAPARASTGPRGTAAAGIASQIVTPPGTQQPTRPVIPGRLPPPLTRAITGHSTVAGGATAANFVPTAQPYQRIAPQIKRVVPARARIGRGTVAGGIANKILFGALQPTVPVLEFRPPPPTRALWRGFASRVVTPPLGSPPPLFKPLPPQARRPAPARALWRGYASRIITPLGTLGPPRPFVFRSPVPVRARALWRGAAATASPPTAQPYQRPAPQFKRVVPARARIGPGTVAGGITNRATLGALQPTVPVLEFRPPPPSRARWRGFASHVVTPPLGSPPPLHQPLPPQAIRPAPSRAHLGPRGTAAGGYASRVVTPLGALPQPRKIPQFPPKITRARIGPLSATAGGVASAIVTPPPLPPQVLPPMTVIAAPAVPMTITINPAVPMTINVGSQYIAPPGQALITQPPAVFLRPA